MEFSLSDTTTLLVSSSSRINDYAILFKRSCSCECRCECKCSRDNAYQLVQLRSLNFREWRHFCDAIYYFYQEMKSSPFSGNKYFILSDYSVLAVHSESISENCNDDNDDDDDDNNVDNSDGPVLTISCYSQNKYGLKITYDEEEVSFNEMEVKKMTEFLPVINKLLSKALFSNTSIILHDQEDVTVAQEYIQWFYDAYKSEDMVITMNVFGKKEYLNDGEKRKKKRKLKEDQQQHLGWGDIDSFGWRKMMKPQL